MTNIRKTSTAIILSAVLLALTFATPVFAPPGGSWSTGASIPTAVEGYGAANVGGIHYYVAGFSSLGDTTILQRYDRSTDTWLGPAASVPGLARAELAAVSHGGSVYGVGGRPTFLVGSDLLRYDPTTDTWTSLSPLPTAVATEHTVVTHGDKIYVAGGRSADAPLPPAAFIVGTLQIYDIASDTWSTGTSMPTPVSDAVAVEKGNKIYVFGGWDGTTFISAVQIYDIASDTWSTGTAMPTARSNAVAGTCGNKMHIIGGEDATFSLSTVHEVYDPAKDSWSTSTPIPTSTGEVQGISTAGQIFVLGGGIFGSGSINPTQNIWKCG